MSNHIHLGVAAGNVPLADWLGPFHSNYAEWINLREKRFGQVFVRGPRSIRVSDDGVAAVIGYIHRNPVRAGIVRHPRESDWTSHRAYVGDVKPPAWLDVELGRTLAKLDRAADIDAWIENAELDRRADPARRGRPPKSRER